ncbi:esterase/lipase LipF, partial [Mycobacterium tuberculosis MAL010109]
MRAPGVRAADGA